MSCLIDTPYIWALGSSYSWTFPDALGASLKYSLSPLSSWSPACCCWRAAEIYQLGHNFRSSGPWQWGLWCYSAYLLHPFSLSSRWVIFLYYIQPFGCAVSAHTPKQWDQLIMDWNFQNCEQNELVIFSRYHRYLLP